MRTGDKAKGAKKKADVLFSKIVRSRGACERCGENDYSKLQCAHIRRRVYSTTRVDTSNAWALCYRCHLLVDTDGSEFMELVDRTIGRETFDLLKAKSLDGRGTKVDWQSEFERLSSLWQAIKAA